MPKSKHRKNHKKKVAARRQRLEEKRRAFYKKMQAQFGEEIAKELAKQQKQSGEEPDNI
jgi:DNA-binding transcriptional MerR regulator